MAEKVYSPASLPLKTNGGNMASEFRELLMGAYNNPQTSNILASKIIELLNFHNEWQDKDRTWPAGDRQLACRVDCYTVPG